MKTLNFQGRFIIHLLTVILNQPILTIYVGPVYVGRKNGDPPPKIVLGAVGIKANHAYF